MTIVANLEEDRLLETTNVLESEPEPCSELEWNADRPVSFPSPKKEAVAYPQGLSTPVRELWPAGLHPWLNSLVLALILVVAANCGIGLGIAGFELAELLYWAFIGLLAVTTMTTIYLAK